MRALIFDRYLDTLGGGERYSLYFALALSKLGFKVEIAWSNLEDISSAEKKFGFDLGQISLNTEAYSLFFTKSKLKERYKFTRDYDLVFWLSDGSLPFLFAKKNFIHIQVPFKKLGGDPIINTIKSLTYSKVIYNSKFTEGFIKKQIPLAKGVVLYPPVDVESMKSKIEKKNIILSVARFDSPSHAKRQDVLIDAFTKLNSKEKKYRLVLAGGIRGKGGEDYLGLLKKSAKNLPVKFIANPSFTELKQLYADAKFFWHAAGYGVDEEKEPEKVEHFGITTVEAMAAGCVPIVINKGGQKEIIKSETGFLCDSVDEIVSYTHSLIHSPEKLNLISNNAVNRAKDFSQEQFVNEVKALS